MAPLRYDFKTGYPDTSVLVPHDKLAEITAQLLQNNQATQYAGDLRGLFSGREQVANFISQHAEKNCHPDELILTNGAIHAVDLVCRRMSSPNDIVIVEAPTFFYMQRVFEANHLKTVSVSLTNDGLDLNELEDVLKQHGSRVKLLYTIPSYHNPTGVCASAEYRRELVALAQRYNFIIVEDATYQWLYFDNAPPPLCKEFDDTNQHVISVGSFSKILMPSLRLGWLWTTEERVQKISYLKSDAATSALTSGIVGEYIRQGELDAQIERARAYYTERCQALASVLERCLPTEIEWQKPDGGFFIWVTLPEQLTATELLKSANARDVDYMPGHFSFLDGAPDRYVRLCYTLLPSAELESGGEILANCIQEMLV